MGQDRLGRTYFKHYYTALFSFTAEHAETAEIIAYVSCGQVNLWRPGAVGT